MSSGSHNLRHYILRRLLLVPFTLFGALLLVYFIIRLAPGPVERQIQQLSQAAGEKASRGGGKTEAEGLKPEQVFGIQEDYERDRPPLTGFLTWAGVLPRETWRTAVEFPGDSREAELTLQGTLILAKVTHDGATAHLEAPAGEDISEWKVRLMKPEELKKRWADSVKIIKAPGEMSYRAMVYKPKYDGLLQGSLGRSRKYNDPVWDMIVERIPVSAFYGILSALIIYGVCIPLGVLKALKHRTWMDSWSSVLVFAGYAIPSYVLGSLLVVWLSAKWEWFPLGGFTSDDFDTLSPWGQFLDLMYHGVLPLSCYVVGGFAFLTMMMKNSLMDNLASDYMRTAVAKGLSYRRAVIGHALRNSLIPIATTLGGLVTLFVGGSFLIERIFDIDGIGLLMYNAVLESDDTVILGDLAIAAGLMMIGNIISDFLVATVDPRVSYQ